MSEGGDLLPGPTAVGGHAHLPSGPAHQCRLDEVVRQHVAAEGLAAVQLGQSAALREGLHPDDGVVAPVIRAVAGPRGQAARDDWSVSAGGELLQPAEQRARADQLRSGLQDAERRVRADHPRQPGQARGIDQAVGVQHDHVIVAAAPAGHEVLQIAGFSCDVAPAPAVPHRHDRGERAAQSVDRCRLTDPGIRVRRIGQYDHLEGAARAEPLQRLAHGLQSRGGAGGVLVVDGHDQRGPGAAKARVRVRQRVAPFGGARDHGARGEGDPGERHTEEEDHHALQHGHVGEAHDLQHLIDAVGGDAETHGNQDEAGEPDGLPARPHRQTRRRVAEVLRSHAEPSLGRHASGAVRRRQAHCGAQRAVHR